jgi:metal-responsive CopG/Arc/MetJ family transcriptional regulator
MSYIKTAISLKEPLFEEGEVLAKRKRISRSRLYSLALEDYLRNEENRQLFEVINQAYSSTPDSEETERLKGMIRIHRKIVEREQ